jgi:hypothetical protein
MLVNRLAGKNKLLMKNKLAVKEISNMLLIFYLPHFLQTWRRWAFPVTGILFGFWIITVNSGYFSCIPTNWLENFRSQLTHTQINNWQRSNAKDYG